MNAATKEELLKRLKRAEGQMTAVRRMVDEDEGCVDVLLQISAVRGALGKAGQVLLGSHIETCVSDALASGDADARRHQVDDLMKIFGRFGGITVR